MSFVFAGEQKKMVSLGNFDGEINAVTILSFLLLTFVTINQQSLPSPHARGFFPF
jgi:hypothetical protein